MTVFGQDVPNKPTIPSEEIRLLRINTLAEEVGELAMASGVVVHLTANPDWEKPVIDVQIMPSAVPDLHEIADALVDCQYFVDGTANAYGLDLDPFFDEVHRANMGKLWRETQLSAMEPGWTATAVVVTYGNDLPLPGVVVPLRNMYSVKRQDGKVMKPPGFQPPNLSKIMEAQKCLHGPGTGKVPEADLADPAPL